jgi:hypothetical protein
MRLPLLVALVALTIPTTAALVALTHAIGVHTTATDIVVIFGGVLTALASRVAPPTTPPQLPPGGAPPPLPRG